MKIKAIKTRYFLAVFAVVSLAISFPALAQNYGNGNGHNEPNIPVKKGLINGIKPDRENIGIGQTRNAGGNFCSRISDMASQEEQRLAQIKAPQDRFANWQQKTNDQDAKLASLRLQWNTNRDAQFAKLEARATTDAQKQAVADFEAATKAAISARQTAVDAAIATFRDGVKDLITNKTQEAASGFTTFSDTVKAAYDAAIASCSGSNPNPATIRATLRTAIAAARKTFISTRQNAPKVGANIQPLIDARQSAVKKALADFKTAMETARTNLKKAFPNDAE